MELGVLFGLLRTAEEDQDPFRLTIGVEGDDRVRRVLSTDNRGQRLRGVAYRGKTPGSVSGDAVMARSIPRLQGAAG